MAGPRVACESACAKGGLLVTAVLLTLAVPKLHLGQVAGTLQLSQDLRAKEFAEEAKSGASLPTLHASEAVTVPEPAPGPPPGLSVAAAAAPHGSGGPLARREPDVVGKVPSMVMAAAMEGKNTTVASPTSAGAGSGTDSTVAAPPTNASMAALPAAAGPAAAWCRLPPCTLYDKGPTLFVFEHLDGSGHRMKTIIEGMAVAARNQMRFGGAYPLQPMVHHRTDHGHDFAKVLELFFGAGAAEQLLVDYERRPNLTAKFDAVRDLEAKAADGSLSSAKTVLTTTNDWYYNYSAAISEYFTEPLLAALRSQLVTRGLQFADGAPSVAFHVRRGDLPRTGDFSTRAHPDEYFFRLATTIWKQWPKADIHVWSNVDPYPADATRHWNSSDFDGYRERGMKVHLDNDGLEDGEDLVSPWAHMARANIFVMSQSSFSAVPAMLNSGCVIYPGAFDRPFPNWMLGIDEGRPSYAAELAECFARAGWEG